jgi:hypothetical protein
MRPTPLLRAATFVATLLALVFAAVLFGRPATPAQTQTPGDATLISPLAGSVLSGSSVTFSWSAASGGVSYALYVGTSGVGSSDLYNQSTGSGLSATVSGLPTDGSTLYVRLYTFFNVGHGANDYTVLAAGGSRGTQAATLSSPSPGSTLSGANVTFSWSTGTGVSQYNLSLGTTVGDSDLYSANPITATSASVSGLPTNGSTVYARLWSQIGSAWQAYDYTYTSAGSGGGGGSAATMTSPTPGSTFAGSSVTFSWTAGSGVTQYYLYLGTSQGGSDLLSRNENTSLTDTVTGLPTTGAGVWVRLWSLISGSWQFNDYQYTEAGDSGGVPGTVSLVLPTDGQEGLTTTPSLMSLIAVICHPTGGPDRRNLPGG